MGTNRTIGTMALCGLLAGIGILGSGAPARAWVKWRIEQWAMALYDEHGTGHNSREWRLRRSNVDQLELKWRFD